MANEKFWFLFPNEIEKRDIDEPINFGDVDFQLNRKENGMGMDASISGGELKFKFTIHRNHYLEDILYLFHKDGFEADLKFGFTNEVGDEFIGEVDFYTAETNDYDYFDCSVILESQMQIFKRRATTKVDLFSSTTIDGEPITPLVPIPMLLHAKPVEQISEWSQPNVFFSELVSTSFGILFRKEFFQINPIQNIVLSGIEDSYTFFTTKQQSPEVFTDNSFKVLMAKSTLNNVVVNIIKLEVNLETSASIGIPSIVGYAIFSLKIAKGVDFNTAEKTTVFTKKLQGDGQIYSLKSDFTFNLGVVERGSFIWVWYECEVYAPGSAPGSLNSFSLNVFLPSETRLKISSESTAYNSTPLTFRLIDVMRQIVKSTSNLDIYAPRYENAGQFYDTVITNGKLLGGNVNDPFYVNWEDIEKSINPEHNADSEIQLDKRVFVGIEADYYTNEECWFFDTTQFSGLKKKPNPMYCLNEFKFKYEKYQSQKEATEPNSASTIHGESILTPFNKKVENSKECAVSWTRDTILLDVQQRLSTKVSEDTATQDDGTVFAIDTIETPNDQTFIETTELSHTWVSPFLSLRSSGDINFVVLGIKEGTSFSIQSPDPNAGNYTVSSVSNSELKLTRISGTSAQNGIRLTKYTYEVRKSDVPLMNRTDEGFNVILNLTTPSKYSNLRYSIQRNIRNYWGSFLATVNLYHKDKPIRNTYYKNNGKCYTDYSGLQVTEKEDWIPENPIVTPFIYENVVFANVDNADFVALQNALRTRRGFIRTIDNNNRVIKLYPDKMSYKNKSRELTIAQAKEKFEKSYLTIVKQNGIITVNDETKLRKLIYKVEEGNRIVLFDAQRQRLYNGVYWDKVEINGALPETLEILKGWLDLLV